MLTFIRNNLLKGLKTPPRHAVGFSLIVTLAYIPIALLIGFNSGLLSVQVMDSNLIYAMPFILIVFPSLFEEILFRGLIIPINTRDKGMKSIIFYTLLSSVIFVLWHPFNALTINPAAQEIFLDGYFLVIAFFLGIACSLAYIMSRSLWAPVLIHWLTVVVWVCFLGGHNLMLAML